MTEKKFSLKDSPIFKNTVVPKPENPEKEISSSETAPPEPAERQEKTVPPGTVKEETAITPFSHSGINIRRMFGLSRRTVGLDITDDQVAMVELERTPSGMRLDKFALASISRQPAGEKEEKVIQAIKEVVHLSGINPRDVIVAIPGNLINHVLLTFPPMPGKELRRALLREVKQHTTTSPEDTIVSYLILGGISRKGVQKQNVLLIMTSKLEVRRYLSLMKESGISPVAISTTQIAFLNLWRKVGLEKKGKAIALVEIKGSTVTVNICRDNQLYLSRTIQMPGREDLELFLSQVRVELDRSFLYYKQQFRGKTVEGIFLSGDSQDIKTITGVLSESLRMEVKEFDPLKSVSVRKSLLENLPPSPAVLTTAVGLAIERSPRKRKRVNLLPEEIQERSQKIAKRISLGTSGLVLVTLLFLTYWGLETTSRSYRQLLASQEERLLQIGPMATKYEAFKKEEQLRREETGLVERLTEGNPSWSLILQDLSNVVPKEIFFREISIKEGDARTNRGWQLIIRGEVVKEISGWRGSLTALLNNLKKSSFLREVVLEPIREVDLSERGKQIETMPFTIRCLLD